MIDPLEKTMGVREAASSSTESEGADDASPECGFVFYEACWVTTEDAVFNESVQSAPSPAAANDLMVAAIKGSFRPLLRPNAEYAFEMSTEDLVDGTKHPRTYAIGFRTKGPVGHSDQLTRLAPYVDFARSYPAPDGNLIGAKPLYFEDPDIRLFFTERYVERFFTDWKKLGANLPALEAELVLEIIDPTIKPKPPGLPPTTVGSATLASQMSSAVAVDLIAASAGPVTFALDATPFVPAAIEMLSNLITAGFVCNPDLTAPEITGSFAKVKANNLRPQTLYSAVWKSKFDGASAEVLTYQFQSSRYPTHKKQIHSYLRDKQADPGDPIRARVFERALSGPVDQAGIAAIAGQTPPAAILAKFAAPYDQLVTGLFGLREMPAAVATEFTAIVSGEDTYALVFQNPEPVNDPRLPSANLSQTVSAPGLVTLLSPDAARAVLVDAAGGPIDGGPLDVTFKSWAFTELGVELANTEIVHINVPPVPPPPDPTVASQLAPKLAQPNIQVMGGAIVDVGGSEPAEGG